MFALWQIVTTLITTALVTMEILSGVSASSTCPYECQCKGREKAVTCSHSMYDQVPGQLPDDLKSLHLEYQNLTILDQISSKPLIHLRRLYLPRNKIRIVFENALAETPHLKTLDLSHNNLDCLPRAITKQTELKELYLQHNYIALLEAELFENLTQLQVLDISSNFLMILPQKLFNPLRYLESLDLSNNSIILLTKDNFGSLRRLEELRLSKNKVRNLSHGWLSGMHNLWVLEMDFMLARSTIKHEDHLIGTPNGDIMQNLETLFVVGNGMTYIPCKHLHKMPRVTYLNMSYNDIQVIEKECFLTLDYLENINLSHNLITEIETRAFNNLTQLQIVDLSHNVLHLVPKGLFDNTPISTLDVSYNRISYIRNNTFNGLWSLESLHLNHNQIHGIASHAFRTLYSLESIDLQRNDLRSIQTQFANLSSLTTLILRNNKLRHVYPNALEGTSLEVLILDSNQLTTLDEDVILHIPNIIHVSLHSNPWTCDCNIRWIKQALDNPDVFPWGYELDITLLQCATPLKYANKSIFYGVESDYNMMCTTYASKLAIQLIVGISFAIIFTSTVLYVLKLYCKIKKLERTGADTSKCLS